MKQLVLALLTTASLHAADPIDAFIEVQRPSWIKLYEHLHANPELSFHEEKTSARMAEEMRTAGFEVTEKVGGVGVGGKQGGEGGGNNESHEAMMMGKRKGGLAVR